jgi:anti-sigma B factor antagonist
MILAKVELCDAPAGSIQRRDGGLQSSHGTRRTVASFRYEQAVTAALNDFALRTDERDTGCHVLLAGELDIAVAGELEVELRQIEERRPPLIVLDLRDLTFIDSSGLKAIVKADARARDGQRAFALVRGSEDIDRVFRTTGLDRYLTMVDDPDELPVRSSTRAQAS